MIKLNDIQSVFFIGIGGIGMSALARYFHAKGAQVSGYDKTETVLTKQLAEAGIRITYDEHPDKAPKDVNLVVYTPAVPATQKQLQHYREHNFPVLKRSEVLQVISEGSFNICVAGTHGKTTITTMIAHILRHSGYGCNAFLGGISANYETNFWSSERNVCVIEADEYDRSFLKLSPDTAVISSMDADHLDIYGTEEALEQAFIDFSARVKPGGVLISKFGLKRTADLQTANHITYSLQNPSAIAHAANIVIKNGSYTFDVLHGDTSIDGVMLNMGGMYNVENVVAAIIVAAQLGIDHEKIKAAVADFKGVKRRFEYILRAKDIILIDDYAHHPAELKALITGAKTLFRGKRITIIFQPHLFSRTRDFASGFAESLDLADAVVLLPIYPAREQPIPGVTSNMILDRMTKEQKVLLTKEELLNYIREVYLPQVDSDFGEVLITAGAGDIGALVQPLKQLIEQSINELNRSRNR